jgi:hypothetical protein
MRQRTTRRWVPLAWTAVLAAGILAAPLAAQEVGQLGNIENTENAYFKYSGRIGELRDAKAQPDAAKDKAAIEVAARYHVYLVTWPSYQPPRKKYDDGMSQIHKRLKDLIDTQTTREGKNKEFMKLLAPEMIRCLKEVLAQDFKTYYTAVTNAAIMLPVLAKCKQPAVEDFLMELARPDKEGKPVVHPFIRLCAIKGLAEIIAPGGPVLEEPAADPEQQLLEKRKRESARLQMVWSFILQPYPPQGTGPEYDDAFTFCRREGVKALAQFQQPHFGNDKGKITGPTAGYLLWIAHGGPSGVGPAYTLMERVEAAQGLCQLKDQDKYNAELGVYIAASVLADFAKEYIVDHAYFSEADKKLKGEKDAPPKRLPKQPWRIYAQRWLAALDTMIANSPKDSAAAKKARSLKDTAAAMLADIAAARQIEQPTVLRQLVDQLRPPGDTAEVYPGNKEHIIRLPKGG